MELWDLDVRDMVSGMPALSPSYNSERGESIVKVVNTWCMFDGRYSDLSLSIFCKIPYEVLLIGVNVYLEYCQHVCGRVYQNPPYSVLMYFIQSLSKIDRSLGRLVAWGPL